MDNTTRAQLSYDAMLARGDGQGDAPEYDAPVRIDGLLVPAEKDLTLVQPELEKLLKLDKPLAYDREDDQVWVTVEGHLEAVTAGEDEREETDLFKALEALGYEPDAITVMTYEDVMGD